MKKAFYILIASVGIFSSCVDRAKDVNTAEPQEAPAFVITNFDNTTKSGKLQSGAVGDLTGVTYDLKVKVINAPGLLASAKVALSSTNTITGRKAGDTAVVTGFDAVKGKSSGEFTIKYTIGTKTKPDTSGTTKITVTLTDSQGDKNVKSTSVDYTVSYGPGCANDAITYDLYKYKRPATAFFLADSGFVNIQRVTNSFDELLITDVVGTTPGFGDGNRLGYRIRKNCTTGVYEVVGGATAVPVLYSPFVNGAGGVPTGVSTGRRTSLTITTDAPNKKITINGIYTASSPIGQAWTIVYTKLN
jgi:hypothetical protein